LNKVIEVTEQTQNLCMIKTMDPNIPLPSVGLYEALSTKGFLLKRDIGNS